MGRLLSSYEEEEEDTEDSISTIIPDGGKVRVSLTMMDSPQKAVAKDAPTNKLLVDDGTDNTLNLHKPGFRISTDDSAGLNREVALAEAYEARELADREAWRTHDMGDHPLIRKTRGTTPGKQEGDVCRIDGRAGHLQMVNGQLECIADRRQDLVEDAYREYDQEQQNAWRR